VCNAFVPARRNRTSATRGLAVEDPAIVFDGVTLEVGDTRKDYGESRVRCYGCLASGLVVIGYTPRGGARHAFSSMRKVNAREDARIAPLLEI
jgi:uncharacterized DUF497 family protein